MKKIFLMMLVLFFCFSCSLNKDNDTKTSDNTTKITDNKDNTNNMENNKDTSEKITDNEDNQTKTENINKNSENKKTFIGFGATSCPHCVNLIPVLDKFYRENKDTVNMIFNSIDKKKFEGDYEIPQDISGRMTFKDITGEECDLIPSYAIKDEKGEIIDKGCGEPLTSEILEEKLLNNTSNDEQLDGFKEGDVGVKLVTSMGDITIKLFPKEAPKTVKNFLKLAESGYYDNLTFHRVMKNFMIQGGDPKGDGTGGESIYGKSFEDEFSPKLKNLTGALSMANSGPNTNGSQFFINEVSNPHLNNMHTVFGQVTEGLENINKIANVKVDANDKPEKDVIIKNISLLEFKNGKLIKIDKKEDKKGKKVKKGDIIKINYILKTKEDKKEIDNTYTKGETFSFEVGDKNIIKGMNDGVLGMKVGEKKTLDLKSKDAYPKDKAMKETIGKTEFENWIKQINIEIEKFNKENKDNKTPLLELKKGTVIPAGNSDIKIIDIKDNLVYIETSHPLAGKDLIFEIELVSIF